MFERSVIEISKSQVRRNIEFIRSLLPSHTTFCSVVKGNAYGHGIEIYPSLAQAAGVECFAVAHAEEAYILFHHLPNKESRIIVMTAPPEDALHWLIEHDIEFYVDSSTRLNKIEAVAKKLNTSAKIHFELETGMYRTGITEAHLTKVSEYVASHPETLSLVGVCTHLAGAEKYSNTERISAQINLFHKLVKAICRKLKRIVPQHVACSSVLIACPEMMLDLARVGVMQYGFWPTSEIKGRYISQQERKIKDPLRQVLTWKTYVHSIRSVPKHSYVGYGQSYLSTRPLKLAVIPVGYADGISRSLSNLGYVLIRGKRAPVVGIVNMNMCTVDITDIKGVKLHDEVVIIGSQGQERTVVTSFSDLVHALNYESLVRLSENIPRTVVR